MDRYTKGIRGAVISFGPAFCQPYSQSPLASQVENRALARAARMTGIPYMIIEMSPDTVQKERGERRAYFLW